MEDVATDFKILIVDDMPTNINVLRRILEPHGYHVTVALTGEAALKVISYALPDLVLMDVMMPGMDGYETCRILKKDERTSDIPIIFITARGHAEDIVRGLEAGGADYIKKPFKPNEVLARIRTHLHNRALIKRMEGLNEELERRVNERTRQLEQAQRELVEKAHQAGMADIATSVLHNVGNVLNSVITSGQMIRRTVETSKLPGIIKANQLLNENLDNIQEFIANDPKANDLFRYYLSFDKFISREQTELLDNATRLIDKLHTIKDIIMDQQARASGGLQTENLPVGLVIEDAVGILGNSMARHEVEVIKEFVETPPISVQKVKLIHILINLLKNAKEAMNHLDPEKKKIVIRTGSDNESVFVTVQDNGIGIEPEHMSNIFNHGFTTKENGHGFGLHSCYRTMKEMGGAISVASDGKYLGATFKLVFPIPK